METVILKKAEFIMPFLGGQPAIKGLDLWKNFMDDKIKNAIFSEKQKKKQDITDSSALFEKVLSVFNYHTANGQGYPIIGHWMLFGCWMEAAYRLGKTQKGGDLPGRGILQGTRFMPHKVCLFRNGEVIRNIDRLDLNVFKPKMGKSGIVTIRECIEPGARFEFEFIYNSNTLLAKDCEEILDQMQYTGLGAWRQKNGWFKYI